MRTRARTWLPIFLLAACQGTAGQEEMKPVDTAHSAIRFQHVDYDPDLAEYAVQRDGRTGNELHVVLQGIDALDHLVDDKE